MKRPRPTDWNLRTCGRRGHIHYLTDDPHTRRTLTVPDPAHPDADLVLCLRCGGYFTPETPVPVGPADQAPLVERGRALRDHALLRLLAAERGLRGIGLLIAAAAVMLFSTRQASWRVTFEQALTDIRPATRTLGVNLDTSRLVGAVEHALHASTHAVIGIAAALAAYGTLQLVEATGLWRARRWGEYVAVIGTSAFLPLEVYELVESVTALKAATLTLNIAAVAWLVWTKRLFGARGGHPALIVANRSASLLPSGPVSTD